MIAVPAEDPAVVEAAARRNRAVHVYALGMLDEPCWAVSRWWVHDEAPDALCGVIVPATSRPLLYALAAPAVRAQTAELVGAVIDRLPDEVAVLADHAVGPVVAPAFALERPASVEVQVLADSGGLRLSSPRVVPLDAADRDELLALYATEADERRCVTEPMLATGCYLGHRVRGELVTVAGVHLFSPERRVAAVANLFTRPDHRGRGLARLVASALCRRLEPVVDDIGMHVPRDDDAARGCSMSLGFRPVGRGVGGVLHRR